MFLIPAGLLAVLIERQAFEGTLEGLARIGALALTGLGGAMFFQGFPYLTWGRQALEPKPAAEVREGRRRNWKAVATATVALLSFLTAVVTLVQKLLA